MKKIYFNLILVFISFGNFAQNETVIPASHVLSLSFKLNNQGINDNAAVLNSIASFEKIKSANLVSPSVLLIDVALDDQSLPKEICGPIFNALNPYSSSMLYANNEQVLDIFKSELVTFKSTAISGLANKSDAMQICNNLLADHHILFCNANFTTHELFVVYKNRITDTDFSNIIKNLGVNVINSSEEISKYY